MLGKNKKTLLAATIFIGFGVLLFAYFINISQNKNKEILINKPTPTTQQPVVTEGEKYISGTISSFSNKLEVDGNCIVTVDNINVAIKLSGERIPTMIPKDTGVIEGISCKAHDDLLGYIGSKIEAYGKWNGHYLTVEGNTKYYIQVSSNSTVNKSPKLQVCPESWSSNRMPCAYEQSPSECGPRDTFVINGQKFNETQVDTNWVKQNCSVKVNIAY